MNLTRAILEGLQEVELEITPEFQKEWPEPHVDNVKTVGKAPSGQSRHLVVLGWPNGAKVTALEVGDVEHGAELNVWAPLSTVKPGDWAHAIESIQKGITYTGGIYVYV
ncbi:MAG: hypothetical protein KAJ19_09555, partial [Gammaproteobacteria bacterium]|nr:hypothetical protein [Gammaproteobacteria bacterium]